MIGILRREFIYLWYYFDVQVRQIFWYWVVGILLGSLISVFAKKWIHRAAEILGEKIPGVVGLVFASALGVASPLCMYGTIPICAAFSKKGIKDDFLAAFMMASILLNPQLIVYSTALGGKILAIRIVSCFVCGVAAGLLVRLFCVRDWRGAERCGAKHSVATQWSEQRNPAKPGLRVLRAERTKLGSEQLKVANAGTPAYFDFSKFSEPLDRDTDANVFLRYAKNVWRNVRATGLWFLAGVALSAVFQRYVPPGALERVFGGSRAWGVLMAATVGVPLYVCGGGTIPILLDWLDAGMSAGSAAAFMITGPSTKITNLGALKIALGAKHFAAYLVFVVAFSFLCGLAVNVLG